MPGSLHRRFAPGVRQLNCRRGAHASNKPGDARKRLSVGVRPNSQVAVGDSPAPLDGSRLCENNTGTPLSKFTQMHQVPVVR